MSVVARVSIVVPSFNSAEFLQDCIHSVLSQSYQNIELIIIDNCSTDKTPFIVSRFSDSRIRFVSEPDNGQGDAVMKGVSLATGDLVMWLNADDLLYDASVCAKAVEKFLKIDVDVVYGGVVFVDASAKHLRYVPPLPIWRSMLPFVAFIGNSNVFVKRGLICSVPVDPKFHFVVDHEWLLRIVDSGARFSSIPYPVTKFRIHNKSKTSTYPENVKNEERAKRDKELNKSPKFLRGVRRFFYRIYFFIITYPYRGKFAPPEK